MKFEKATNLTDKFLMENHTDYYLNMMEFVKEDVKLSERMWLFQNGLSEKPICLNCDEKVNFIKFSLGYRKFCSKKCSAEYSNKNDDIKRKRVSKIIEYNNNPILKREITEKSNRTKNLKSKEENELTNTKRNETNIQKWGVKNVSELDFVREKISYKLKEVLPSLKIKKTIERIEKMDFKIKDVVGDEFNLICKKCDNEFTISRSLFNQRSRFNIEQCLICNPNNNDSFFENDILKFIEINYGGIILPKYRKYKKYEIDIYLPELSIGFECNGLWWHSEKYKENNYHRDKSDFFKKENIKIIHIWEDDWKYKKDIIKSRILNLINKSYKIGARKCDIVEIDYTLCKKFLDENHLQGNVQSSFRIGLKYNNELVSLMTFGKLRKNLGHKHSDGSWELLRFVNKRGFVVQGGASKLLKYFIKEKNPQKLISYASRDWSSGDLYKSLGFKEIKNTVPNYFYFHKDEGLRLNRFNFRKDRLVKLGFDLNLSEHQIMFNRGWLRVYDSGSILYDMSLNNPR